MNANARAFLVTPPRERAAHAARARRWSRSPRLGAHRALDNYVADRDVEGRARVARPRPGGRARAARDPRQRRLGRASSRPARSSTSPTRTRCSPRRQTRTRWSASSPRTTSPPRRVPLLARRRDGPRPRPRHRRRLLADGLSTGFRTDALRYCPDMGFIVSLLIIAIGAILTWGVNDTSPFRQPRRDRGRPHGRRHRRLHPHPVLLASPGGAPAPSAGRATRAPPPDTTTRQRRGAADAAMWSRKRKCRSGRRRSRLRPPARRLRSHPSRDSASSISSSEIVSGGVA